MITRKIEYKDIWWVHIFQSITPDNNKEHRPVFKILKSWQRCEYSLCFASKQLRQGKEPRSVIKISYLLVEIFERPLNIPKRRSIENIGIHYNYGPGVRGTNAPRLPSPIWEHSHLCKDFKILARSRITSIISLWRRRITMKVPFSESLRYDRTVNWWEINQSVALSVSIRSFKNNALIIRVYLRTKVIILQHWQYNPLIVWSWELKTSR